MSVVKPKPGSVLATEDDSLILVVLRGWTDETIREHLARWLDEHDTDTPVEYNLATWRYHTAAQMRAEGTGSEYDSFWSPDGWGATTIDVALVDL